jgi:hypothetical protein
MHCAGCFSNNYVLSDDKKYLKCNDCNEIYYSCCIDCGSYNTGTVDNQSGSSFQCKDCGICSAMYEIIPYDKPKFNGKYPEDNSSQKLMDCLGAIHISMKREPTFFEKLKFSIKKLIYGENYCRLYL